MKFIYIAWLMCGMQAAIAAEMAVTLREIPLKARPAPEAQTLAMLPSGHKVEVTSREGGWVHAKAGALNGWISMFGLRLAGDSVRGAKGDSGIGLLASTVSTGRSGAATAVLGVRGLSEEQLKNARPDLQALRAAKAYMAGKDEAQRFVEQGGLHAQTVDYLAPPGDVSGARDQ